MSYPLIIAEKLTKKYKENVAVNSLNLEIEKGEIFGLLGPNGAGKTTTISMLDGILKKTSGRIFIKGVDIDKNLYKVKDNIGFAPQESDIYNRKLTVKEYLIFFGHCHNIWGGKLKNRVEEVANKTGLWEHKNKYVNQLSGGLKKRLILATSIIHKPEILFVDEPSLGVDPKGRRDIRTILKLLNNEGTTIIINTNYVNEAEILCDRIGILRKGNLIACKSPDEIKQSNSDRQQISIETNNNNLLIDFLNIQNYISYEIHDNNVIIDINKNDSTRFMQKLISFLYENNILTNNLRIDEKSLEDIFIDITQ